MLESLLKIHRKDFEEIFFEFFGTERIDISHALCDEYRDNPVFFNDKISIIKVVLKDGRNYEELFRKLFLFIASYTGSESIPESVRIKKARRQFMRYVNIDENATSDDISRYREIGEFILYFLTESVLWYPMLISKMNFKTNTNMAVNGSDGIHVGINGSGELQIYLGESKICNSLANAKKQAKESFNTSLSPSGMLDKDLNLLWRNQSDWHVWGNPELRLKLEQLINPFFLEEQAVEGFDFDVVCLLGYECADYKTSIDDLGSAEYLEKVGNHLKWIFKSFKDITVLWERNIQFFLLPLFDHEGLVRSFLTELNHE